MEDASRTAPAGRERPGGLLFRNRDYTGWWIGDTFADFGTALSLVAYPLLVLAVTGSVAGAGTVQAAAIVGSLATMLFGGACADRSSRRALMITGPIVQSAAVGTVVAAVMADQVALGHLAAVGFVQGLANGMTQGAQLAALRRLVPAEQMPTAWGQYEARTMTIRLVGPALGGLLFGLARWAPFLIEAVAFLGSVIGTALIRRPLGPDPGGAAPREPVLASIGAGLRFIRGNAYLRFSALWVSLVAACHTGLVLLVIVLVDGRGGSAALVGAVSSAGAIGGLAGALLSNRIAGRVPGRRLVIAVSWLIVAVALALGSVPGTWTAGALLAVLMFLNSPLNVVLAAHEMRIVPDELMGRVQSAMSVAALSLQWLGPLTAGLLASAFGPTAATAVFACAAAVLAVATHLSRGLRSLDAPTR
ncbi:MFS transporter [Nocardiopsis sp. CNT-189]|uniref:MFS transporter n=1 Tax=Nocardiopsis oceanisediminis TaxID=2816862 RepID=UPI003B31FA11